ncbi:acetate--CoA ligase family protein [Zwartia sp.]|uniref:acetate--CoA ligase family protein n=1 Tax=Zwartia sp. TaxID=2978004 RepID=UPI00272396E6|nr:acetate--CoA ligase family protein [Zwartia sp.]MDO9023353.1 acetate--CoA ligase family protein [Zwartia sp.]
MNKSISATEFAQALFSPRAVALIGASGNLQKNTARPLRFMRKHGFTGKIYPINRTQTEIMGEPAYPDLASLPGPIDHAFVMVASDLVLPLIDDCARAGAKVITIYSDGFGEVGPEGMLAQQALIARANELGVRIIGPNSIGLADLRSGMILSVNAAFEAETLISGELSLVSQSGSMMGSLLARAAARGFGFAKSVSVGNESDVTVGEVVNALVDDADTKVILLFLETIRDSPTLARALERARAANKPVIAYKIGRSEQGDALAQSHTGALAGNDVAVDAFLRAHGVMRVRNLETLFELAPLAQRYLGKTTAHPQPARVAVITTTGGGAATVVDNLGLLGMVAVAPPPAFVAHMAQRGMNIRPTTIIDLTLAATSAQYKDLLEQLLQTDWCDAVLSVVGSSAQFHPELAVKPLVEANKPDTKPVAVFLAPEAVASLGLLQKAGIPAFRTPESCADALSVFFQKREQAPPLVPAISWPAHLPTQGLLTEYEAGQVFKTLGVQTAQAQLVSGQDPQHSVPYPVVVKVSSRDIPHKTEAGGVKVGLRDATEFAEAIKEIARNAHAYAPQARLDGFLVQAMESRLIELILGYRNDPLVGPTIILGAGGITAELSPDFAIRLAPVTLEQAHAMIDEVRLTKLIKGFRGLPKGDCEALAQAVVAFSKLSAVSGVNVLEAEINPLFVQANKVLAVDGLVRLE